MITIVMIYLNMDALENSCIQRLMCTDVCFSNENRVVIKISKKHIKLEDKEQLNEIVFKRRASQSIF